MAHQITAKIWITADTKEEADKIYNFINSLDRVVEMDWLDGEEV